jgi:hypothetical protein
MRIDDLPHARDGGVMQVAPSTDYYSHGFYKHPDTGSGELEIELVILYAVRCARHTRACGLRRGSAVTVVCAKRTGTQCFMAICALEGVVPS